MELKHCWVVNVPHCKYGYSFAVNVGCDATEEQVIGVAYDYGLFDYGYGDAEIANAEQMTEYDYEFWKNDIVTLGDD